MTRCTIDRLGREDGFNALALDASLEILQKRRIVFRDFCQERRRRKGTRGRLVPLHWKEPRFQLGLTQAARGRPIEFRGRYSLYVIVNGATRNIAAPRDLPHR